MLIAIAGLRSRSGIQLAMNSQNALWSDLPVSTGIATLVCYAGIFGDVISVDEIAIRLGASRQDEFAKAIDQLKGQGRIIIRDGFAALPHLGDKIGIKTTKIETTARLIGSQIDNIKKLGRNPFIKFVGISGSLAANNPTEDKDGLLDIDVFLITRNQCLWLYEIPRRIRLNLSPRKEPEPNLCINYVMDESDLRVENRNFYTATEIRNLIPVVGLDSYRAFLRANDWVDYYYPGFSGSFCPTMRSKSCNLINKSLYVLVTLMYCLKYSSLEHLRKLAFKPDQSTGTSFNRVGPKCGGYQVLVHEKFRRLVATWFADLVNERLIERLFPDELSREIRRSAPALLNATPYQELGYDYNKYGFQQILPKSR